MPYKSLIDATRKIVSTIQLSNSDMGEIYPEI